MVAASDLDEQSLAMARRIVQKMRDRDDSPPSWKMVIEVLEGSFLGVPENDGDFYQSSPHEARGRERALHWLAHEDEATAAGNLSEDDYDRGLLERYALATIYFATGGDDWKHCSRSRRQKDKQTGSPCESDGERYLSPESHLKWSGINGKDGKVTWLDLTDKGLVSSTFLPLEVTLLSPTLELLWVSENDGLGGTLPNHLGQFQSLVSLSAYKTSVAGTIPNSVYTLPKLNSIRLYKSKFEGSISSQIKNLAELKWFWVHDNALTGTVPNEIGELGKLEGVTLHGNKFRPVESGETEGTHLESNIVPDSLCNLKKGSLKHLWTDCEAGALVHAANEEGGNKAATELVVKEGVQACSCCTRCFPRNDDAVVAAVK